MDQTTQIKHLVVFLIAFSIFISWHSAPMQFKDFSSGSAGGVRFGLPRWHGHDFSIVPAGIFIPVRKLPTEPIRPAGVIRLPRDLERDFDP